ncbi:MAG: hypothetical protein IT428_31410 [Planctomycetaceae bacterium]|nr:hypothetical protein [Planctomycetaceae bacterium]
MWLVLAAALTVPEVLHVESDAVLQAAVDASANASAAHCYRYAWQADADKGAMPAVSMAANTAWSKSPRVHVPDVLPGGRLIRLDFIKLFPKEADRQKGLKAWDKLAAGDTAFYVSAQVKTTPYRADDGKTYDWKWSKVFGSQCGVWRDDGPPDMADCTLLTQLTKTETPLISADRFVVKSLSQIEDGIYYELSGVRKSQVKGRTDFEQFLEDHGVDAKKAEELKAERRAAVAKSGVTKKPRAIEHLNGLLHTVVWTEDIQNNNRNPKAHALLNLINPKFDAIEAIALKSNGMCDFAIFNAKGELQDSVPDTVARDDTIPGGYPYPLNPAISCIRCHAPTKGFRTLKNDVLALQRAQAEEGVKFDITGDGTFKDDIEAVDRIAGLYQDNLDDLDIGRQKYSDAVFKATLGLSVEEASNHLRRFQDRYQFEDVTPQRACLYMGVRVEEKEAIPMVKKLLSAKTAPHGREDGRIGFLKIGTSMVTQDWEDIRPDALIRSRPAYNRLAKELRNGK